jgi:hypothetical protein
VGNQFLEDDAVDHTLAMKGRTWMSRPCGLHNPF